MDSRLILVKVTRFSRRRLRALTFGEIISVRYPSPRFAARVFARAVFKIPAWIEVVVCVGG